MPDQVRQIEPSGDGLSEPSVVILATDGLASRAIYHGLKHHCLITRVILEDKIPRLVLVRNRIRRLGIMTVVGQLLFQVLVAPALQRAARRRQQALVAAFEMDVDPIPDNMITRVRSANSRECIEILRKLAPMAVIVSGTRILSRQFVTSISCPLVNWHAGVTPLYRGVHGGYWALSQRDPQHCGVTVHLIDEGIDTGPILSQAQITPSVTDNVSTYPVLQVGQAIPLLRQAMAQIAGGRLQPIPGPSGESRLWSHPTIWHYLWHRLFHGVK